MIFAVAHQLELHGGGEGRSRRADGASARHYVSPYWKAVVYTGLSENASAVEWLDRAFEERFDWMASLGVEPMFDSLRGDPAFESLLRRLDLPP